MGPLAAGPFAQYLGAPTRLVFVVRNPLARRTRRLPEPIEVAAYYGPSEALANAAKHARASHITVALGICDGSLLLSIRDDGVGGADRARGSGLVGLTDRVATPSPVAAVVSVTVSGQFTCR